VSKQRNTDIVQQELGASEAQAQDKRAEGHAEISDYFPRKQALFKCAARTLLSTSEDAWKQCAAAVKRLLVDDLTGVAAKVASAFPHIFRGDCLTRGSEAGLKIIQVKQAPPLVTCA